MSAANVEWVGSRAYLKASRVNAALIGRGNSISFPGDGSEPQILTGDEGEEIQARWDDHGTERLMKFYFARNNDTNKGGWKMFEARMYPYREDWIFWDKHHEDTMVGVPENFLFQCEYFEINYSPQKASHKAGKFVAHDIVLGAFLPDNYDLSPMRMYNPCRNEQSDRPCSLIDGVVSCSTKMSFGMESLAFGAFILLLSVCGVVIFCRRNPALPKKNARPKTRLYEMLTHAPDDSEATGDEEEIPGTEEGEG